MKQSTEIHRHTTPLPPFLDKLLNIVTSCPKEYGSWTPEGDKFVIHNKDFNSQVLSRYFTGTPKTQLHFYGFKKQDHGDGAWSFQHDKLLRDNLKLIGEIKRKSKPSSSTFVSKREFNAVKQEAELLKKQLIEMKELFKKEIEALKKDIEEEKMKHQMTGSENIGYTYGWITSEVNGVNSLPIRKKRKTSENGDVDLDMFPVKEEVSQTSWNSIFRGNEGDEFTDYKKNIKEEPGTFALNDNFQDENSLAGLPLADSSLLNWNL
eukprot:maker-scaffold_50-snap-gene-1.0-mRNA-1 protein AED:0.17 eAED:0.69 QI:120/0/0.5/1/0/0.5/2/0/263